MADERLIPDGIRDESTKAFNELIDRLGTLDLTPLLVYIIDNVDASALPHLAEQFHVMGNEGWKLATTDDEKRQLIKSAIELHRYKGTKYALKKVLEKLNIEGRILEWFEYNGAPYKFKVELGLTDREITIELRDRLLALVKEYKNERSWLEEIILTYLAETSISIFVGNMGETKSYAQMLDGFEWNSQGNAYTSAGNMGEVMATTQFVEV